MRGKGYQFGLLIAALGLAGLLAGPARANGRRQAGRPAGKLANGGRPNRNSIPPNWLERLHNMAPEEQERFLRNNQRFRSLPPEKQAEIRSHLQQWNRLTPQQREALRQRAQVWQRIPPEERKEIRQEILPKWRQMSPGRRQLIVQRLRQLGQMDSEQRQRTLSSPEFMRGLHPDEQEILRKLSDLRLGQAGEPAP